MRKIKIIKKEIDQWGPLDARPLYVSFWFKPVARLVKEDWQVPWPYIIGIFDHDKLTFYWQDSDMVGCGFKAIERWIVPVSKFKQIKYYYQTEVVRKMKEIASAILSARDNRNSRKLRKLAVDFYNKILDFWSICLVPEVANFAAAKYLSQKLSRYVPPDDMDRVIEVLLAPTRLSFHQQSELDLLLLFKKYKSRVPLKKIREYLNKWHWVENSYYSSEPLKVADIKSRLRDYDIKTVDKKISSIRNYNSKTRARKLRVYEKYNIPSSIRRIVSNLSYSIWWQDQRKGFSWWFHSIVDEISSYFASLYKVDFDDLMYYLDQEWVDFITQGKKVKRRCIQARKKLFLVAINGHNRYIVQLVGAPVKKIIKEQSKYLPQTLTLDKGEIRGVVVSRGKQTKIMGRVKVLLSAKEVKKMKKGEILVAPMTSPDYIQAMRRAKAIITDVGGVMSHAAVVSRELGIPCIVGTKVATKVLRDGDLVEVDAEKGVVIKLR